MKFYVEFSCTLSIQAENDEEAKQKAEKELIEEGVYYIEVNCVEEKEN